MSGRGFGHKNKRLFKGIISGMIALVCLIPPTDGRGASTLEEKPLEEGLVSELTYLLSFVEKELKAIQNLPNEDLMRMARDYLLRLEKRSTTNGLIIDKQAEALLVGQKYLHSLSRSELKAFVILEYMKQVLNHAVNQEPLHHGTALDVSGESKKNEVLAKKEPRSSSAASLIIKKVNILSPYLFASSSDSMTPFVESILTS